MEDLQSTKRLQVSKSGEASIAFEHSALFEHYDALALEALGECRKAIMMALRYLNRALWYMPFEHAPLTATIATSGSVLRYDPEIVLDRYSADVNELVRDCLHAILHCTLHHPFDTRHDDFDAWSLACDIAVELCAIELTGARFPSAADAERLEEAHRLGKIASSLSAPSLYKILRSGGPGEQLYLDHGLTGRDIGRLSALFKRDGHELWAGHPHDQDEGTAGEGAQVPIPDLQNADTAEAANGMESDSANTPSDASGQSGVDGERQTAEEDQSRAREDWENISKRIEAEMRAQRHAGSGEESMLQNLAIANKKPANYRTFLKRFATIAEDMCINDDEFDYIFYTFGIERYGNIPLVEPLEYRESERVREFVIALDTSGSCSGELIRAFVQRTYDILRQESNFGGKVNVHLVQCDNRIQTTTKVTSLAQLKDYEESFWVSGGGGTDFKPVFEHVDSLVERGEFENLRGVIYFTDGYGSFPVKAPAYDVAFVFVDDDARNIRVPAWAMKVVMTSEEVLEED